MSGSWTDPAVAERAPASSKWFGDWQHERHAVSFDIRAGLDPRNLVRNYEGFNDVRLLNERIARDRHLTLLEVGCATGEFFRYLGLRYPAARYVGVDISRPAVARAKQKYPHGPFFVIEPSRALADNLQALGLPLQPEVVYAKDVIQHHPDPFGFLAQVIGLASDTIVLRGRTRDRGASELDPEQSCQYHYDGWMPYLVLNLQELLERVQRLVPQAEVAVSRHYMLLGGRYNRFVPKALYLKETGTAETAIGIFKTTSAPGRVTIQDRRDHNPRYTWDYRVKHALRQGLTAWRQESAAPEGASSP